MNRFLNLSVSGPFMLSPLKFNTICFGTLIIPIYKLAGPYEGSQVQTELIKVDWWGPLAPVIPELLNLGDHKLLWIMFYSILIGALIFFQSRLLTPWTSLKLSFRLYFLFGFQYLSSLYVLTNGRDGLAYFFVSASFTFYTISSSTSRLKIKSFFIIAALVFLLTSSLFKITILPLGILVLLIYRILNAPRNTLVWLSSPLIGLSLIISGLLLNSKLSETFDLSNSFPEQQVMFYDLANVYCWSQSQDSRNFARDAIEPFRSGSADGRALCSSAVPYGWDPLRLPWLNQSSGAPINQILPGETESFSRLSTDWINLIFLFPEDWIESKINNIGQVLFMSNVFFSPMERTDPRAGVLDLLLWIILMPAYLIDSIFLTSLAVSVALSTLILWRKPRLMFLLLLIQLTGLAVGSITFVANNGRYTFSTVLLSLLVLLSTRFGDLQLKSSDRLVR